MTGIQSSNNRLYIIGNGFDLAHNLRTRFSDFLLYHLKAVIKLFVEEDKLLHEFIAFEKPKPNAANRNLEPLNRLPFHNVEELSALINTVNGSQNRFILKGIYTYLIPQANERNWVDVERKYFDILLLILERIKANPLKKHSLTIEEVNNSLKEFLIHFEKYLQDEVCSQIRDPMHIAGISKIFDRKCKSRFALNFNYTNLIQQYSQFKDDDSVHHIHGQVGKENMVLGYGDEHDKRYEELEDLNDDQYLEYTKSPWYTTDEGFNRFQDFMEEDFDVYILGHSCGLSDRTLLRDIFERSSCKEITIFHRGSKESDRKKKIALSRHFRDKSLMRKKVVHYKSENRLPQHSD